MQHLHDIADVLVERMRGMTEPDAEAFLEDALTRLAVGAKQLEATTGVPDIASSVGYKISTVVRTRVEQLRAR